MQRLENYSLRCRPELTGLSILTCTGAAPALLASSFVPTRFLSLSVFVPQISLTVSAPLLNYMKTPTIFKWEDARWVGSIYTDITFLIVSLSHEANIRMLHPHLYRLRNWIFVTFKSIHKRLPSTKMGQQK